MQIKSQATGGFQAFIIHYREDPDQQNLIDWIQEDWVRITLSALESLKFSNYSEKLVDELIFNCLKTHCHKKYIIFTNTYLTNVIRVIIL